MAGNWWLPAVSVICMVHTALLLLITFLKRKEWGEVRQSELWNQNLLVRILDSWRVGLGEGSLDKPVHQTSFANSWTWNDQIDNSPPLYPLQPDLLPRRWQPCSRCSTPALLCCDLALCDLNTNPSFLHFASLKNSHLQFIVWNHWHSSEKRERIKCLCTFLSDFSEWFDWCNSSQLGVTLHDTSTGHK